MRRFLAITLVGVGTLTLSGCNLFPGSQDSASDSSEEPATAEITSVEETVEEKFPKPIVPSAPSLAAIVRAELIQSTDPDERFQQVQRTRTDPYAELTTPPPEKVVPPQEGGGSQAGQPSPGAIGADGVDPISGEDQDSGSPISPLPELPQPALALAVEVSGVVQVGSTVHAIIKAPDEASSRYVRVGQRLSNGRILVKRIEMREGAEPVVVLEQNGIEVARPVGSGTSADASA